MFRWSHGLLFRHFWRQLFFEESRQNSNSQNCWVKRTTASADLELLSSRYSLLNKSSVSSFFPPPKLALLIFSRSPYFLKHCQLPTSELHEKFLGTHNFWLNQIRMMIWWFGSQAAIVGTLKQGWVPFAASTGCLAGCVQLQQHWEGRQAVLRVAGPEATLIPWCYRGLEEAKEKGLQQEVLDETK